MISLVWWVLKLSLSLLYQKLHSFTLAKTSLAKHYNYSKTKYQEEQKFIKSKEKKNTWKGKNFECLKTKVFITRKKSKKMWFLISGLRWSKYFSQAHIYMARGLQQMKAKVWTMMATKLWIFLLSNCITF